MATEKIFISYSKKDSDLAHKLANDLEAAGFKIWIDRSIGGGDLWRETIEINLRKAEEVIIVVSPNSMDSEWVKHEGSLAYGWGKKLYPILISPTDSFPPWLEEYQYIDFVNAPYEIAFSALASALIPPNPIQDLLDMQVIQYNQTEELISENIYRVIEESYNTLRISPEAEDLIQKSRNRIVQEQRATRRRFLGMVASITLALVVVVVAVILAVTGQINRLIYRPVDMDDYWVDIPAGEFWMGSNENDPGANDDEFPKHRVYLNLFQIGRYETTNRQYNQCVLAGICPPPNNQEYNLSEVADHPVVDVKWFDAQIYCEWVDGRLPTEAEWEKAARGGWQGTLYPWGNEAPDCSKTNFAKNDVIRCNSSTSPVGSYGPYGEFDLFDMAGNASEWVADRYGYDYYATFPADNWPDNPQGSEIGIESNFRVLRGGSWGDFSYSLRVASRDSTLPSISNAGTGFRCARSP